MEKPKTTQIIINEILDYRPFIKDHLRQNIINYSELARNLLYEIKDKYHKTPNLNAIIMAISRYAEKIKKTQITKELLNIVAEFDLNLANDMVSITLRRNLSNHTIVSKIYDKINWVKGERMYLFQSSGEIAVLLNRKNAKFILEKLKKKPSEILQKEDDLSILIVNTPPRMVDVPGIMYYLTGLVAHGGITLIDIVSTFTEIIFAVRSTDGIKIYAILDKAIKKARNLIS
ncbi:MAG: hypothetical protein ACTSRG_14415 [Candidatus Helarchaeota archaeon]